MKRAVATLSAVLALVVAPQAVAAGPCERLAPWNRVGRSLEHYIEPVPLILTGLSPVPVLVMAPTGLDHDLRLVAQDDWGGSYKAEPVSLWTPYVLGGSFVIGWGVSALLEACDVERPLAAMVQAMAGGLVVT